MSDIKTVGDLKPDDHNANKGTAQGQKAIVGSIQRSGAGRSIVVDKHNRIIGGNKTAEAIAETLGTDSELIVIESTGEKLVVHKRLDLDLDDPDPNNPARRLAYADNMTSWASFDLDPAQVMTDIEAGFDFDAIDISIPDLGEMLGDPQFGKDTDAGKDTEAQADKAKELQEKWQTELGQLWRLGEHRLAVGDCTDSEVVARVMGENLYQLMVTDPPYGVNYEGGRNPKSNVPRSKIAGDLTPQLYNKFLRVWKSYRDIKGVLYIWFASSVGKPVYQAIEDNGFTIRALIIWNKLDPHYGNFMAQYLQKHEPCLYCVDGSTNWYGPTNEPSVWDIKQPNINEFHPTQKPLECMERPIRNSSKTGDIIVDPFLGSGTTLIACENLSRRCFAIELDPGYVAVALQRWADHTGKTPELIDTWTL